MPDNPPGARAPTGIAQRLTVLEAALKAQISTMTRLAERLDALDDWRKAEEDARRFQATQERALADARLMIARDLGIASFSELRSLVAARQRPAARERVSVLQWYADLSPAAQKTVQTVIGLIVLAASYLLGHVTTDAPQQLQPPPASEPLEPPEQPSVIPTTSPSGLIRRRPTPEGPP